MCLRLLLLLLMTTFITYCSSGSKQSRSSKSNSSAFAKIEDPDLTENFTDDEELDDENFDNENLDDEDLDDEDLDDEDLDDEDLDDEDLDDEGSENDSVKTLLLKVKVSGFSGDNLLLKNENTSILVEEDGIFTFETQFANGDTYEVSIESQTADNDLNCEVDATLSKGTFLSVNIEVPIICSEILPLFIVEDPISTGLFQKGADLDLDLTEDDDTASGRFCLLSLAYISKANGGDEIVNCETNVNTLDESAWNLLASSAANGTDQEVECSATCISWSDDDFSTSSKTMVELSVGSGKSKNDSIGLNSFTNNSICGIGKLELSDLGGSSEYLECIISEGTDNSNEEWSLSIKENNDVEATCGARCLDYPLDSGVQLYKTTYSASREGGKHTEAKLISLVSSANSYCFLTKVKITGATIGKDSTKCEVYTDINTWVLKADIGDYYLSLLGIECEARCIQWEE